MFKRPMGIKEWKQLCDLLAQAAIELRENGHEDEAETLVSAFDVVVVK